MTKSIFFREVAHRIQEAKREPSLEDGPGRDDYLYISCLPWIHFTSISHPIKLDHTDAIPRITWGKVREEKIRTQLPISVQVHHGLVDGLHVAQFIERLQSLLDEFHIEYAK